MHPEDTLRRYGQKINNHDFDQLVPFISEDAVFWFNDGSHIGLNDIRAAFERTWKNFPLEAYWLEDVVWVATDEQASACTYSFRWKTTIDGKLILGGGRGTSVFRKDHGVWKIAHEHLSAFPK